MAKINEVQRAKIEGMQYALEYAKKNGIEALEEETKFRCSTKLPYTTNRQQVIEFQEMIKQRILSSYALMSVLVLREKFEFTNEDIEMFSEKFKENTEQLMSGDLTWQDTYEEMVEEVGFSLGLDKEIINMKIKETI